MPLFNKSWLPGHLHPLLAQVTLADKPLSHYALNVQAEGDRPQSRPQVDVPRGPAVPSPEELTTGLSPPPPRHMHPA